MCKISPYVLLVTHYAPRFTFRINSRKPEPLVTKIELYAEREPPHSTQRLAPVWLVEQCSRCQTP